MVCLSILEPINNQCSNLDLYDWLNKSHCMHASQFQFIALVDKYTYVRREYGSSYKIHCQLQPKNTRVILLYNNSSKRQFMWYKLRTRQSALVLKIDVLYGWQSI